MSTPDEQQPPSLDGIATEFHPVVLQYGRELFALCMNAGIAGQAAEQLSLGVGKNPRMTRALRLFCKSYNELSNEFVMKMGWPPELVAQCDRDIQLAFAGKLVVPEGGKIILNS